MNGITPATNPEDDQTRLTARIRRLEAIRYCGVMTVPGMRPLPIWNDDGGTRTSFSLRPGETIGQTIDEIDRQWAAAEEPPITGRDCQTAPELLDERGFRS